jgi:hypothetical protein
LEKPWSIILVIESTYLKIRMLTANSSAKNLFSPIKFLTIKPGQTPSTLAKSGVEVLLI